MASQALKHWLCRTPIVILDAPLFFEAKMPRFLFDDVICVSVDHEQQKQRLMHRSEVSVEDAVMRIDAQMPLRDKRRLSTIVIDNSGTLDETYRSLDQVVKQWKNQ
jgi:dephospho-CoA kinase